jgi:hypothetical protein
VATCTGAGAGGSAAGVARGAEAGSGAGPGATSGTSFVPGVGTVAAVWAGFGSASEGVGGLARDDAEAVRLFKLAVASNDPDGQFRLGYMNAEGRGVAKNAGEAKKLMKLAAAQGNPAATRWLEAQ